MLIHLVKLYDDIDCILEYDVYWKDVFESEPVSAEQVL